MKNLLILFMFFSLYSQGFSQDMAESKQRMSEETKQEKKPNVKTDEEANDDAQVEKEPEKGSLAINFLTNSFAGFHPAIFGNFPLKSGRPLTFYAVYWTNPAFGNTDTGTDFWFEHGVGTVFKAFDNNLIINPSLGFSHGKLLSGSEGGVVGDGIIPSVFLLHDSNKFNVQFYLAYYKSLRSGEVSKDFIFNWVNPSVKLSKFFSVGLYYEQFVNTRDGDTGNSATSINQWFGGSVRFSTGGGHSLMIALGKNFSDVGAKEFHKISAFMPIK